MLSRGCLRRLVLVALLSISSVLMATTVQAKVLQGSVEDEDMRLSRPSNDQNGNADTDSLRIQRPDAGGGATDPGQNEWARRCFCFQQTVGRQCQCQRR